MGFRIMRKNLQNESMITWKQSYIYFCSIYYPCLIIFLSQSAFAVKRGKGKGFLTYLKTSNPPIVVESYPLHQPKEKDQLKSMLNRCMLPWRQLDLKLIRNYFGKWLLLNYNSQLIMFTPLGEEVAFYFAWMNFYSTFVIIPAIIGLFMFLLRPSGNDVDTDAYLPFYSVFIAIWGMLFLVVCCCHNYL